MRRSLLAPILVLTLFLLSPAAAGAAVPAPVLLGANTMGMTEDTGRALDEFAADAGRMPRIVMSYRDWNEGWSTALIEPRFIDPVLSRGAIPMITWLPRLGSGDPVEQPAYSPAAIAAGAFDPFIVRASREARAFGQPLFIRLAHEMNGCWDSWGVGVNGNAPGDYVAMWRHVVSIFRAEGADNVRWVWSPNVYGSGSSPTGASALPFPPFYPGDRWVDFVALDGYNWGALKGSGWESFFDIFKDSYDALVMLTAKPVMIAETASAEQGGSKAAWIRKIPAVLRSQMPRVRALIWFDRDKETDWRINSSPLSSHAFRLMARDPLFSAGGEGLLRGRNPRRWGR
jgi:Glycosyl hydrolase family 26